MKTDSAFAIAAAACVLLVALCFGYAREASNHPEPMTLGGSSFQVHAVNGFASSGSEHYAENSPPVRDGKRLDHGYGW